MESLEFSLPYNNDLKTLEKLLLMKNLGDNRIREIYLSGPQKYSGSGRIVSTIDMVEFIRIVDKIHEEDIKVNLVINSTCEGIEWYSKDNLNSMLAYIQQLHVDHGVESITIANPLLIKRIRKQLPDIEICASVLGNIDCVQRAVAYRDAGADIITPDVNINRDLDLLNDIKEATSARLKLLVNEGCLYKCPFRQFHFNVKSHASKESNRISEDISFADFFDAGTGIIRKDVSQLLKSCWVRPEDTRKYSAITTYFKLVDRSQLDSFVLRAAKAYLEESWQGDLLDLVSGCSKRFSMNHGAYLNNKALDEYNFFRTVTNCDHKCKGCKYCEELAKKLIALNVFTPEKGEDSDTKKILNSLKTIG